MNKLQKQKIGEHLRQMAMKPKPRKYFLSTSDKNYDTKRVKTKKDLKNYAS